MKSLKVSIVSDSANTFDAHRRVKWARAQEPEAMVCAGREIAGGNSDF